MISPKCRMMRKGLMGGFCYKKLKVIGSDKFHETPDKNLYSHIVEALEYAVLGEGEGIAAIQPADSFDDGEEFQTHAIM